MAHQRGRCSLHCKSDKGKGMMPAATRGKRSMGFAIKLVAIGLLAALLPAAPSFAQSASWMATASMETDRRAHTATVLPNGKVLVAGGLGGSFTILSSAEVFDPVTETWSGTGSMNTARQVHTATLLPNGK